LNYITDAEVLGQALLQFYTAQDGAVCGEAVWLDFLRELVAIGPICNKTVMDAVAFAQQARADISLGDLLTIGEIKS
jgi:hypothetical protein